MTVSLSQNSSEKTDVLSLDLGELTEKITALGLPKYRASQIYSWLHRSFVTSFDEMTNVSKADRQKLADSFEIYSCAVEKRQISRSDDTTKYLFRLRDGEFVESVLMKYKYGWSLCVSSQVGCRMGCRFCASTIGGMVRNLRASEILSQAA